MSFPPGARLGPYEIIAAIGAGGMGQVFRARDTKLDRGVAIKVLPAELAQDRERLARFEREAKLLASLNHSNIAHVYGFESATLPDGSPAHFLAMELVEGEDLADRLKHGAIPVDESIAIAKQIAEGLEEAHEHGIIHRDLKPANIKVTPDGKVKVLDFGLAKALEGGSGSGSAGTQLSHSPTMSRHMTEAGMIMGTAAYMSPEQARGKQIDKRSDIWSFGVVLFEMLTGKRLFSGETVSDVLAAVLRADPNWSALPALQSASLKRLLARCLERDPRERFHDIADVRLALGDVLIPEPQDDRTRATSGKSGNAPMRALPWIVAGAAIATAAAAGFLRRSDPPPRPPTIFGIQVPEGRFLTRWQSPILDIAGDGRTILFVAEGKEPSSIFRRSVDRRSIQRIDGTEGAENPILSPDGRWIAFFAEGKLRKAPAEGGAAVAVADALAPRGVAFGPDGSIVFSPMYTTGLFRVPATGGTPVAVTKLDAPKERSHRWPQVLPDGRSVIFTVGTAESPGDYDGASIDVVRLDTGERKTVIKGARMARYTSRGYLVFQRGETLLAAPFDAGRLEVTGESFTILEGVSGDPPSGSGYFAVSDAGLIVATPETSIPKSRALVLVDASGKESPLPVDSASYSHPRISPDGRRLTYAIGTGSAADDDVFVLDLATSRVQRLTFGSGHGLPIWTSDGKGITYTRGRAGTLGLALRAADGSGEETVLLRSAEQNVAGSWHPDGKRLLITNAQKSIDITIVEGGRESPLFANPNFGESMADFSPDARFVAYTSTETGRDEVIVETFPQGAGKWQVSTAGGTMPVWSRDGRFLYFVSGQSVLAVPVELRPEFRPGTPRVLFSGPFDVRNPIQRNYDVGPDGRFIMIKRQASSTPGEFLVLEGWEQSDPSRAGSRR